MKLQLEGQTSKPSFGIVIVQTFDEDNPDPGDFREDATRGSIKQAIS